MITYDDIFNAVSKEIDPKLTADEFVAQWETEYGVDMEGLRDAAYDWVASNEANLKQVNPVDALASTLIRGFQIAMEVVQDGKAEKKGLTKKDDWI